MLNAVIRFALQNRLFILCVAVAVIVGGAMIAESLPIDVLPDLTRPRVVLITECHGMAPEEVEQRVTFPLETAIHGSTGVIAVRSSSDIGLSVINVEFDWGFNIHLARQIVQERVATVLDRLPEGVQPQMGPVASLLGQIMIVGMWSRDGTTSPLALRSIADWEVRQQLLAIGGVAQVITMGGGRMQVQVLVDLHRLHEYEVSLADVERSLRAGNLNVTGGYISRGAVELPVRGIGQVMDLDDIRRIVVKSGRGRPVLLAQVAEVKEAAQFKRGDSFVNGQPAVILTIQKQPGADTRRLTKRIVAACEALRASLPKDVVLDPALYQQREFIDHAVTNVVEALRDGAMLVVIVLFLFLFNLRTTFITLTAIPISVLVTALVFRWFGMSINVMTLGGLAVALGELVDDAIVDVENIFRRLRENGRVPPPKPALTVVFEASSEVRSAIVVSTAIILVVFAPLFGLSGMEGRLFTPLGVAYLVSILASMVVSLTVTPVLSYYLLPGAPATHGEEPWLLRLLKRQVEPIVRFSMTPNGLAGVLAIMVLAVAASTVVVIRMGKDFLPPFDEGAAQVNLYAEPGTSLASMVAISQAADREFLKLLKTDENPGGPLLSFTNRIGRAEMDEHVMGVHVAEYIMTLNPNSGLSRAELIARLHEALDHVAAVEHEVEQPIAHLISHMLSGVTAQIAIKVFGDDFDVLRAKALEIRDAISSIEGLAEPVVEQQQIVPQLRIELDREQLAFYGVTVGFVNDFVETAMHGKVVSQLYRGSRTFDLVVRLDEQYRLDLENLSRMPLDLPSGAKVPLGALARVFIGGGPNGIERENARRRIVVRVHTLGRDLASAVDAIQQAVSDKVSLDPGYVIAYGGQFEAQRGAMRRILGLSILAAIAVLVILYSAFPSWSIVLQILVSLPIAFVGGVLALVVSGQTLSVAAMVGFISLGGIAARNGLLLVSTYVDLRAARGYHQDMIVEGSLTRLAPVLMTALTTGIGLLPLVAGGQSPGREILYPVATVIVGGLTTSTLCEFLVRPGLFWAFTDAESTPRRDRRAESVGQI